MSAAVEEAVAAGDLDRAIAGVMEEIRAAPQDLGARQALFQLCAAAGERVRAARQLDAILGLDPATEPMVRGYRALLLCEEERAAVLAGRAAPVCIGQPRDWMAMLVEALRLDAVDDARAARDLRERARDAADAVPGTIDGTRFAWLMDADTRFGPVLEVAVDGKYRWLPVEHLLQWRADPPRDLRDTLWLPATLTLRNGGELHAFVFVRYPGSETAGEGALRLGRATAWEATGAGEQRGLGQRLLASDVDDHPVLAIRRIAFDA